MLVTNLMTARTIVVDGANAMLPLSPGRYCASTATLISGDEVCLSLLEYTVGSVQPNTVPLAGQLVRIIGTQFPTDGTNTMQCTVGGTVSASTLVRAPPALHPSLRCARASRLVARAPSVLW